MAAIHHSRSRHDYQTALYRNRRKNHAAGKGTPVADPTQLSWGTITFASNPLSNATITLGGTVVTFGTDVAIGGSLASTLASLLAFLNASVNVNIIKCTYAVTNNVLGIRSKTVNNTTFTLAASAATRSNPVLQLPTTFPRIKL
jgi:hypothetical protein